MHCRDRAGRGVARRPRRVGVSPGACGEPTGDLRRGEAGSAASGERGAGRPPRAPPPSGNERRSPARLTLELPGLCLGLLDRRDAAADAPEGASAGTRADPLQDITTLPGIIAHELSNPLTAARAGLQLVLESLHHWTDVPGPRRRELADELGQVIGDIDRAVSFLRAIKDRARGALARSERFDAVRVVRSCCTLEARVLKERHPPLECASTLDRVY